MSTAKRISGDGRSPARPPVAVVERKDDDHERRDLYQGPLPGLVIGETSVVDRSGVSSFQRTDPIGRSNMRRIRIGSGPI